MGLWSLQESKAQGWTLARHSPCLLHCRMSLQVCPPSPFPTGQLNHPPRPPKKKGKAMQVI